MEPESSPAPEPLPTGLCLFPSTTTTAHRRRRLAFLVIYLLVGSLVLWPVFPFFAGAKPLILGLPLSMAWVVFALTAMFGALLWLYLGEDDPRSADEPQPAARQGDT